MPIVSFMGCDQPDSSNNTAHQALLELMQRLFLLLMFFAFLLSASAVQAADIQPQKINGFHAASEVGRVDAMVRMSGDGTKMVFVVKEANFDTSLQGWLTGREGGWSSADAAKVYLHDLNSGQTTLLYQGGFGVVSVNGTTVLQSLEGGFSVDINRDGSRVLLAYSSISMSGVRNQLVSSLKFALIDTRSQNLQEIASLRLPSYIPVAVPLRISEDGLRAVFAYEPAADKNESVWGVEFAGSSNKPLLMSLALNDVGASPIQLSDPVWGEFGSSDAVISGIGSSYIGFFDLSADGNQVVFHNSASGNIYAISADGSGRRQLASVTGGMGAEVAISGDGTRVAFAERGDSANTVLYTVPYLGGSATEITRNNTYFAGNLKLNQDGSRLLYQDTWAAPGSGFEWPGSTYLIPTAGSSTGVVVGKELADASTDVRRVLTRVRGWRGALDVYLSQLDSLVASESGQSGNVAVFDGSVMILSIPSIDVGGSLYQVMLLLESSNPPTLRVIQVDAAMTLRDTMTAQLDSHFNVSIPCMRFSNIQVDSDPWGLVLQLQDAGQLLFGIHSIVEPACVGGNF
jgi:hypothetical protein